MVIGEDDRLREALGRVSNQGPAPEVGVVLGSGLGAFAQRLSQPVRIRYQDIPHFPPVAVEGHAGRLHLGRIADTPVACLAGRVHLYEGHSPEQVVFAVRVLAALGCRAVLLTNAAGAIRGDLRPGDLMLIADHINLTGHNPLVGPNRGPGPRCPDLTRAYDPELRAAAQRAATEVGVQLHEGVYAAMLGPSYETAAEIRMLRTLGADAVGMSTVVEVIALCHAGVRVGAMSLITNVAAGLSEASPEHAEVARVARAASDPFTRLLARWVQQAHQLLGD
jgi:purine-nucleoside phosphorylase